MKMLLLVFTLVQLLFYWRKRCLAKACLLNALAVFLLFGIARFVDLTLTKEMLCFAMVSGLPGVLALPLLSWL